MAATITVVGDSRVHRTARAEVELALRERPFAGTIVVGLAHEIPTARPLIVQGLVRLPQGANAPDAFEMVLHDSTLFLLGSTPRGMLHAVFAFQELQAAGEKLVAGRLRHGTFAFRERVFHPRFNAWPGIRADVRFIAHLGALHCLVDHDWQGSRRTLQGYVTSPLSPQAVEPQEVARNRAGLRRLLDDCADYGLGAMLWLTALPCQGGPWVRAEQRQQYLDRFPVEILSDSGTHEGQVLCFIGCQVSNAVGATNGSPGFPAEGVERSRHCFSDKQ